MRVAAVLHAAVNCCGMGSAQLQALLLLVLVS
jgi:hypothetical protein